VVGRIGSTDDGTVGPVASVVLHGIGRQGDDVA
jgi:hypothetical protein